MDGNGSNDPNNDMNEYLLGASKVRLRDRILLSPYTKFLLPSLLVAFVVPVTVYAIMINSYITVSIYSETTCNLRYEYYVDCMPGKNTTESECNEKLCCWDESTEFCYHSVPSQHGYTPDGGVYYDGAVLVPRETKSPLGSNNIEEIHLDIAATDSNHLEISISTRNQSTSSRKKKRRASNFIFYQSSSTTGNFIKKDIIGEEEDEITQKLLYFLPRDRNRRTVEIQLEESTNLNAYVHYPEFSVTVARSNSNGNESSSIFSTARGPLILTESYWEWTFYITNGTLYGLNDLELNGTTNSIYNNENGTIIPAFLAISETGEGSAYYVDYKGPLEIQVLNVSNLIILRGMSLPDNLVVHVFSGPTPLEAVRQLTQALSSSSEYSSSISHPYNYGLHICPSGNLNSVEESVTELNETITLLAELLAPWDSHCLHEKLASVLNHFLSTDDLVYLDEGKTLLENSGRQFSPHLSPMISQDEGGTLYASLLDAEYLLSNGSVPYVGLYQEFNVVYPDWENDEVKTMATSFLVDYLNDTGSPESVWLRDTWPKDETNSSSRTAAVDFTLFDYMPEGLEIAMNNLTLPYDLITTSAESHHKTHNSYSEGFRTFVRSSASTIEFFGPNAEGGNTTWSALRRSVRSAVGAGIVGQLPPPNYVCGTSDFDTSLHDQLCVRWYQAAVTWPYILVLPDRLPGGEYLSTSASLTAIRALRLKASLSTYQNTLIARFFKQGTPVLAPTSLHYPEDTAFTHEEDQFMWGEAILVGLVTLPDVYQVQMRLPGDIPWRHLMGGSEVTPISNETIPVTANVGELITLVRPGYVVPIHKEIGETTTDTILTNLTLVVNTNCEEEDEEGCVSTGEIYYGSVDGDFLNIEINSTHLILGNVNNVTNYVCNETSSLYQLKRSTGTFIETVELLGNLSYQVNIELCNFQDYDNLAVSLT